MHHAAQRGAVRRARGIVSDVLRNGIVTERITQTCEQLPEFLRGKQVEQHQHVGLLRKLVAVGAVILRLEDEIETLDIAVADPVILPIELTQRFVAFELTDDPVVMKRHVHPATDVIPTRDLFRRYAKPRREFVATHGGQQIEHLHRPAQHPHRHDVGVGIVVEAGRCGIRIAVVKLVRTHHATDLVSPALVIEVPPCLTRNSAISRISSAP